jgi:hypothetical protein
MATTVSLPMLQFFASLLLLHHFFLSIDFGTASQAAHFLCTMIFNDKRTVTLLVPFFIP